MMGLNVIALNIKTCSKPYLCIVKKKTSQTCYGRGENLPKKKEKKRKSKRKVEENK